MKEKETAIQVRHLTRDFGEKRGIFDFTFDVKRGEVFSVMGTNGSGKTTTIRHMMGFLRSDPGTVTIEGRDAWQDAAELKKIIGYVPGQIDFPDVGSGKSFLKIQAEMAGIRDFTRMNDLIDRFGIDISAPLRRMSKGMKQKMALVTAFMEDADLYLLDEPSTGLDPLMRDTLIDLINEEKRNGKTVFMSTHIFKEIEDTSETVMFIQDGHILKILPRRYFTENPHEIYDVSFAEARDFFRYVQKPRDLAGKPLSARIETARPEYREVSVLVPLRAVNTFLRDLSHYHISSFSSQPYSLESYYTKRIESQEA